MLKPIALALMLVATTSGVALSHVSTSRPPMDIAFCIDTTGSMQQELDVVKTKTKELVAKLSAANAASRVRIGLVAFRDRGDAYVTKVFQFTDDVDKIVKDISDLQAAGGGDGPEAVNEALHASLTELNWNKEKGAKLLFLIGDAAPHKYANDYRWESECKNAIGRGIQINTIACDGLEGYPEAEGTGVFRQIAKLTDGRYEALAYRQTVAGIGGGTETIVRSAGVSYRVRSADKEAWRGGVAAMEAVGAAEPVLAPAPPMALSDGMRSPVLSMVALPMPRAKSTAGRLRASRDDSNLADILLTGAREAARKASK